MEITKDDYIVIYVIGGIVIAVVAFMFWWAKRRMKFESKLLLAISVLYRIRWSGYTDIENMKKIQETDLIARYKIAHTDNTRGTRQLIENILSHREYKDKAKIENRIHDVIQEEKHEFEKLEALTKIMSIDWKRKKGLRCY
jgi:hypothetical protein